MPVSTCVASKPGLDGEHALEAREQQAGADEQHERERDLRGDEHAAHHARAARLAVPERPSSRKAWLRFMCRRLEDRNEPDEQRQERARGRA